MDKTLKVHDYGMKPEAYISTLVGKKVSLKLIVSDVMLIHGLLAGIDQYNYLIKQDKQIFFIPKHAVAILTAENSDD